MARLNFKKQEVLGAVFRSQFDVSGKYKAAYLYSLCSTLDGDNIIRLKFN